MINAVILVFISTCFKGNNDLIFLIAEKNIKEI